MPVWDLLELNPKEYSLYQSKHYELDNARLRSVTVRKDGFASIHTDAPTGVDLTRPLVFSDNRLRLNYSTPAAGSICIDLWDAERKPIAGFSDSDSPLL